MYVVAPHAPTLRESRRHAYAPLSIPRALAVGTLTRADDGAVALAASYDLPGVDVVADGNGGHALRFAAGFDPTVARVVAEHVGGGMLYAGLGSSAGGVEVDPTTLSAEEQAEPRYRLAAPTPAQLRTIQAHVPEGGDDLDADTLFVFERFVANNALSRGGLLQLTDRALDKLAADYAAGRSVLLFHDTRQIIGRTFAARVERKTREGLTAKYVHVWGYMDKRASNEDLRRDIGLGILAYDSVGFNGGDVSFVEEKAASPGGGPKGLRGFLRIDHDPDSLSPLYAVETSLVYMGELHGAGNTSLSSANVADVESGEGGPNGPTATSPDAGEVAGIILC